MRERDQEQAVLANVVERSRGFWPGLAGGAAVIAVLLLATWLWRNWDPETFMEWRREAGPVPFFIALALLPAVGVPTTPFYILAGATFSPWVNALGIALSLAVHVTLCYWIAHSWMRRGLERLLLRFQRRLPQLEAGQAVRFALLVKMAPGVPTFLKTYLIGMSGVSFPVHFAICFGITACYATAFVALGDSIMDRDASTAAVGLGLLLAIAAVLYLIHRRLKRPSEPSEKPASTATDDRQKRPKGR